MDLDYVKLDIECPGCGFHNEIRYRDARLRDVVICRGCKGNIRLEDSMNECRKARREVKAAMDRLVKEFSALNTTINIKF